jgi:hypothetical protein
MMAEAWDTSSTKHLVLHFHGGLINHKTGVGIAERLAPVYEGTDAVLSDRTPTGAVPCFFIWDSGALESLTHNLPDVARDPLFQKLMGKVGKWVMKKVSGGIGLKGVGGSGIDGSEVEAEMNAYFSGALPNPPSVLEAAGARLRAPETGPTVKAIVEDLDEDELATEIRVFDIDQDIEFQNIVQAAAAGTTPPPVAGVANKGVGAITVSKSPITDAGAERLFGRPQTAATKGIFSWISVAKEIASIVIRVIKRHHRHRDHGMYITISEEILRDLYVDDAGGIIWNQMKKDTADAFARTDAGGSVLLQILKDMATKSAPRVFSRITLIGHSTGAVFICNFVDAAVAAGFGTQFEVIFLAPAVTHQRFAATLRTNQASIQAFRQFGMHDALEGKDSIVPIVYPHSLLYFVSGLLEWSDKADALIDEPLVGMERFIITVPPFDPQAFADVEMVRAFLTAAGASRIVWSDATLGPGMNSTSHTHGDFDNDPNTLESLAYILRQGF